LHLTDQHKALLLTLLITGTVILSVFNLGLKLHEENITETYYEMEPEKELTEEEIKILEALESRNNAKAETNAAFNETQESKRFAQAYKTIAPAEDYVPKNQNSDGNNQETYKKEYEAIDESKLKNEELSSFDKVNDLLNKQKGDGNNSRSSISFSLINREKKHIPIPIYLCEKNGKVIINITVNSEGDVTDAYLNSNSTSTNDCLVKHALTYAKESRFSTDSSKESQIGTITFSFVGKR